MTTRVTTLGARSLIIAAAVLALLGIGCGGGSHSNSLSVNFTPSTTAQATGLVKLIPRTGSGSRLILDAVIYGPDTSLDLFAFAFDIKIGDTTVAAFVPGSATAGNALVASTGQTVNVIANTAMGDPSDVVVGVSKSGTSGSGNGIAGSSAVIVEMAFDVLKPGQTTLSIAATPTPQALNSSQPPQPIGAVTFDTADGTIFGLSSGSPY